ncbi:locomotion-related protein Hikaru genki-like [Daphnia pulex]|uniref:locomotion-related protein Hikaru genki-like n=1 Tax=Daphnia pulex TaxID=6669 RepID=UPI001EDDA2B5|nr:locomotion-related protein Hikaru genki-like [Daphnia pulex]
MHFTIGTLRITCWWGNVFLQLVIFMIGQSEVCGRRISIETTRNDEISNNLGFNTSSRESSIKATALTNAISDNLEIDDKYDWYQPLLRNCRLHLPDEKNIILSYYGHHSSIAADAIIPHGTTLVARCPVLGKMKLLGAFSIQCFNGKWSDKLPTCLPTTPSDGLSAFVDDHPPTIKTNIPTGSAGENAAGELVVRPRSVVHLDCIFYRKLGNPRWTWKKSNNLTRNHPFGWAIAREERLWRFRISIFSIQARDEGEYTCTTPRGHNNSIRIVVQTIQCPQLAMVESPLKAVIEGNHAGQKAIYLCMDGYRLLGSNSSECLTSGLWSETKQPVCELIQCPYDMDGADPRLEFDFLNGVGFQAMVKFSCPPGYQLIGPTNATCQKSMNWFPSPPSCQVVECPELLPPLNGRIKESGSNHFVGDVVKFSCNRNFQLLGQSEISCMENGTWSFSAPQCQMYCSHPGSPTSGFIDPNNYIYEIGATVQVGCNSGLKLQGRKWLTCQQDGSWSSTIGLCISDF